MIRNLVFLLSGVFGADLFGIVFMLWVALILGTVGLVDYVADRRIRRALGEK